MTLTIYTSFYAVEGSYLFCCGLGERGFASHIYFKFATITFFTV